MNLRVLLLLATALFVAGCSGGGILVPGQVSSGPSATTEVWGGTLDPTQGDPLPFHLEWSRQGGAVSGTAQVRSAETRVHLGPLQGRETAGNLEFTLDLPDEVGDVTLRGAVAGGQLVGTWTSAGPGLPAGGTFTFQPLPGTPDFQSRSRFFLTSARGFGTTVLGGNWIGDQDISGNNVFGLVPLSSLQILGGATVFGDQVTAYVFVETTDGGAFRYFLQGNTTNGDYLMNGVDGTGTTVFDTGTWTVLAQ